MNTVYVIDACSLIDALNFYDMKLEVFDKIWGKFDEMIEEGTLITSSEVKDELKDDELKEWVKGKKDFFQPLTEGTQQIVKDILNKYPKLIQMKSTGNSNADPFLIATAINNNGVIVTEEIKTSGKNNIKIPNVCEAYNIEYMNLQKFIKTIFGN